MAMNPYDTPSGRLRRSADKSRRQFLGIMGGVVAGGAAVFGGIMSLKFMFPAATNEEPLTFRTVSEATQIPVGSHYPITEKRIDIIRDDGGFYAVYLICTHLGCTPNYSSDVTSDLVTSVPGIEDRAKAAGDRIGEQRQPNGWKCPCHGSRYFIDSTNFYGPAPRPMDWVKLSWTPDSKGFIVDRGSLVVMRGAGQTTPPTWRLSATPGDNKPIGTTLGV